MQVEPLSDLVQGNEAVETVEKICTYVLRHSPIFKTSKHDSNHFIYIKGPLLTIKKS
jgi:hypothetical protein